MKLLWTTVKFVYSQGKTRNTRLSTPHIMHASLVKICVSFVGLAVYPVIRDNFQEVNGLPIGFHVRDCCMRSQLFTCQFAPQFLLICIQYVFAPLIIIEAIEPRPPIGVELDFQVMRVKHEWRSIVQTKFATNGGQFTLPITFLL